MVKLLRLQTLPWTRATGEPVTVTRIVYRDDQGLVKTRIEPGALTLEEVNKILEAEPSA